MRIGDGGLLEAFAKLDRELVASGHSHLISKKTPITWIGREVGLGQIGKINHGGLPKVLLKPGRYPGFPLRNWWAREWGGTNLRECHSHTC